MSKMYVMIGAPGSGKSTYIKNHIKDNELVISRDIIRFAMLNDGDDYFSKEKQVYNEFIKQINAAIANEIDIYVDQTSLNRGARSKLFSRLERLPAEVIAIYIKKPLNVILKQNAQRTGRALVPKDAVINMYNSIEKPEKYEGFTEIWTIE